MSDAAGLRADDGLSPELRKKAELLASFLQQKVNFSQQRAQEVVRDVLADDDYRTELDALSPDELEKLVAWAKQGAYANLGHLFN